MWSNKSLHPTVNRYSLHTLFSSPSVSGLSRLIHRRLSYTFDNNNMKAIPIVIGSLVSLYWITAFSVVYASYYIARDAPRDPWWEMDWLRDPGYWLMMIVFDLIIAVFNLTEDYLLGDGHPIFIIVLVITALFIGAACWFFAYLFLSRTKTWRLRYK